MPFQVPIEVVRERFPQWEIISPLSPSEQKAAFRVRDGEGRLLCLKIISPDYQVDRLQRELRALRLVKHEGIARFVQYACSVDDAGECQYIVEEFVEGTDLAAVLNPDAPWSVDRAAEFFEKLSDALAVLDECHIVHRDLKPTNIRVRPDGSPVLIDFGLARHLDLPSLTATQVGGRIGTPKYFSPEQFEGTRRDIDHRTDLFAVGILMYEAVVGVHPFWSPGMSLGDLCTAVCSSEDCFARQEFAALPASWRAVIRKLLEKSRARRPAHASQVREILASFRGQP